MQVAITVALVASMSVAGTSVQSPLSDRVKYEVDSRDIASLVQTDFSYFSGSFLRYTEALSMVVQYSTGYGIESLQGHSGYQGARSDNASIMTKDDNQKFVLLLNIKRDIENDFPPIDEGRAALAAKGILSVLGFKDEDLGEPTIRELKSESRSEIGIEEARTVAYKAYFLRKIGNISYPENRIVVTLDRNYKPVKVYGRWDTLDPSLIYIPSQFTVESLTQEAAIAISGIQAAQDANIVRVGVFFRPIEEGGRNGAKLTGRAGFPRMNPDGSGSRFTIIEFDLY